MELMLLTLNAKSAGSDHHVDYAVVQKNSFSVATQFSNTLDFV